MDSELDGEKLWRHQVFGARMREKNGRKHLFFSRDSESSVWQSKVQPGEARFGPELDGEKLWRHAKVQPGEARFGPELDGGKAGVRGRMREKN